MGVVIVETTTFAVVGAEANISIEINMDDAEVVQALHEGSQR